MVMTDKYENKANVSNRGTSKIAKKLGEWGPIGRE
jgi:hypothetical protein